MTLTRRAALAALLAAAAAPALAEAPRRSPRPAPRPGSLAAPAVARTGTASGPATADLIAAARLGGKTGAAVIDVATGALLDAVDPGLTLPPASCLKAITALYALERLGPDWRFTTRLIATGPIAGGTLEGDLILAGGGDPTLTTDTLGDMAAALRAAGLRGIAGRFVVNTGALPQAPQIDADQPVHVGYNPAVAGLNLNFNRVHFEWKRAPSGWQVQLDARGERFVPLVRGARVRIVDRATPVYTYADRDGAETWSVAAAALGQGGSRWLPVRRPGDYAGEVFRTLAAAQGITLPEPVVTAGQPPAGTVLAQAQSPGLGPLLRDMLRHSTNLTAEAVGLAASRARSLRASAEAMAAWVQDRYGVPATFVDHSGLGAASRITPQAMATVLARAHPAGALPSLLRPFPVTDRRDGPTVVAKTGTLSFVSGLAGYATAPSGRVLAFAIFAADLPRRAGIPADQRERPAGGSEWTRRARGMQARVVERWATVHA
jgi:D-alanyl-D-alanine carboxypeptidase/D-alanyl-D-alanine-endopeptidase (penicillin-binding protein 4)